MSEDFKKDDRVVAKLEEGKFPGIVTKVLKTGAKVLFDDGDSGEVEFADLSLEKVVTNPTPPQCVHSHSTGLGCPIKEIKEFPADCGDCRWLSTNAREQDPETFSETKKELIALTTNGRLSIEELRGQIAAIAQTME